MQFYSYGVGVGVGVGVGAGVGVGVGVGVGGTNGGLMEVSGPAAAPLLPPPAPLSNPVQNAQPQLSITPVSGSPLLF